MQGATLRHVTIFLDGSGIEAAGYVALSRVRHDDDWCFVGGLTTRHLMPASLWGVRGCHFRGSWACPPAWFREK
eukprot:7991227-Prorocentrum_lima.AAC.1